MESTHPVWLEKLPDFAQAQGLALWQRYRFRLDMPRKRATKLGDYRFERATGRHRLTVNADQRPLAFLITFLHEIAHLLVHEHGPREQAPHGTAWKQVFRDLMAPYVEDGHFPEPLGQALERHLENPKASAGADARLAMALEAVEPSGKAGIPLAELGLGAVFTYRKVQYKKLEVRRTRALCERTKDGKKYLVPLIVPVEPQGTTA